MPEPLSSVCDSLGPRLPRCLDVLGPSPLQPFEVRLCCLRHPVPRLLPRLCVGRSISLCSRPGRYPVHTSASGPVPPSWPFRLGPSALHCPGLLVPEICVGPSLSVDTPALSITSAGASPPCTGTAPPASPVVPRYLGSPTPYSPSPSVMVYRLVRRCSPTKSL